MIVIVVNFDHARNHSKNDAPKHNSSIRDTKALPIQSSEVLLTRHGGMTTSSTVHAFGFDTSLGWHMYRRHVATMLCTISDVLVNNRPLRGVAFALRALLDALASSSSSSSSRSGSTVLLCRCIVSSNPTCHNHCGNATYTKV